MSSDVHAVSRDALTPLRLLERTVRVFPDEIAVVHGDLRWSYRELSREVGRLAGALARAGVARGDRVAFLAPNVPALLAAHFAVPRLGAVLVAINTRLHPDEVGYILDHSGARVVLCDVELAPLVRDAPASAGGALLVNVEDEQAGHRGRPLAGPSYEAFVGGAPALPLAFELDDEERVLAINYTSGTTGRPKGVMYTHRGAYLNAFGGMLAHGLGRDSAFLWTLPMFHCNGWCFPWAVTAAGGRHALLRKVDPPLVWRLVREERVTHFNAAPTVLIMLVNDAAAPRDRLPHAVRIATGGAPPSPTLLAQWEAVGAELTHLYGLTETYGPHTFCDWQPAWSAETADVRARLRARQGVAHVTACEVRVVDADMRDVPADGATLGEVVMRGNNVMAGYFRDPEATAAAFRGGWFHSGDVGVLHPDGYVELRDRAKDVVISGGENISTIEVEQAIASHPDVLEVAVVAVPDDRWGEVPKAFVTSKEGRAPSAADLIAHCRARLAHFKCPKQVEFGPLPKTSTGKVQKFVLREREWAGREKRIQ